jgi:hypothetical protein
MAANSTTVRHVCTLGQAGGVIFAVDVRVSDIFVKD